MDRRRLLLSLGAMAGGALVAPAAHANIRCTPINPMGLQQCEVGLESSVASVRALRQQQTEWCWAASISMVFAYHDYTVDQVRIVQEAYGQIVNMPGQPQQMLAALNRQWIDDSGSSFSVRGDVFSANPMTAAQDLAADQPLIIGTSHHAMVLTALTYVRNFQGAGQVLTATVRDPWPLNPSRRYMTPQEWSDVHFLARIRVD